MVEGEGVVRRVRRNWPVAEKRRIVELTLEPGARVALVARSNGLNSNQVFGWRRAFERGELAQPGTAATTLLPVLVPDPDKTAIEQSSQPEDPGMRG
jgi:transposase